MTRQIKVGDTFTHQRTCDKYRPIYYAGASGDFNSIHIDREVGELAGLGGNILHGMCTLAWAVESAIGFVGDPGRIKKIRVRFSRPVSVQDTLTFEGKVTSAGGGRLVAELRARNQRGEEVLKNTTVEASLQDGS